MLILQEDIIYGSTLQFHFKTKHTFIVTANELKECIQRETAQTSIVHLTFELFSGTSGLSEYNRIIRNEIPNEMGIYLWENADTGEIIYIGMAGKMKANGEFVNHTVRARLLASRGKDPNTGRDIQTNAYLKSIIESDAII